MGTVADDETRDKTPRRRYDASGRRAKAAQARRRIVDAAADLFAEQGYAATTLDQIGERAGVTAKLVAANGPKRRLLLAAFEQRFVGSENPGEAEARADAAPILAERDPRALVEKLADHILSGQERGIGLWRALTAAAGQDAEIQAAYLEVAQRRLRVMSMGIDLLAGRGLLRPGDRDRQVATLALLFGFDPYQLLVLDWGWAPAQLRAWTIEQLETNVIDVTGPDPSSR